LRSYFPKLKATAIKAIIQQSVTKPSTKTNKPGTKENVPMSELCQSGGIVNALQAVQLAAKRTGS
jgi:cell wall-associated protease